MFKSYRYRMTSHQWWTPAQKIISLFNACTAAEIMRQFCCGCMFSCEVQDILLNYIGSAAYSFYMDCYCIRCWIWHRTTTLYKCAIHINVKSKNHALNRQCERSQENKSKWHQSCKKWRISIELSRLCLSGDHTQVLFGHSRWVDGLCAWSY